MATIHIDELVSRVADEADAYRNETKCIITAFTKVVTDILANGDEIKIQGFGTFYVDERSGMTGVKSPQDFTIVERKPTKTPKFRAGKLLSQAVKGCQDEEKH